MRALCWHGKSDVRVDTVPDPVIQEPTDAIIKITSTAICGSDLHLYDGYMVEMEKGDVLGHELQERCEGSRKYFSQGPLEGRVSPPQTSPFGRGGSRGCPERSDFSGIPQMGERNGFVVMLMRAVFLKRKDNALAQRGCRGCRVFFPNLSFFMLWCSVPLGL